MLINNSYVQQRCSERESEREMWRVVMNNCHSASLSLADSAGGAGYSRRLLWWWSLTLWATKQQQSSRSGRSIKHCFIGLQPADAGTGRDCVLAVSHSMCSVDVSGRTRNILYSRISDGVICANSDSTKPLLFSAPTD